MEEKRYSVDIEYLPDLLRGIGNLFFMAQGNAQTTDETMFSVSCVLEYIADDMNLQIIKLKHSNISTAEDKTA